MTQFITLIGGLMMFFAGMHLLRAGLAKLWGRSVEQAMHSLTATPARSMLLGILSTALLQSSSAVTVLTIALIDSSLMAWPHALGIVLGSNIGTCITAQVLSFHLERFWWLLVGAGLTAAASKKTQALGYSLLGLGTVLLAMQFFQAAAGRLEYLPTLKYQLTLGKAIIWGTVITAVLQSSSAFIAIVISMGAAGSIDLYQSIGLILGSNLGTCITALLAAMGGSPGAKKIACSHLSLNLVGILATVPFFDFFVQLTAGSADTLTRQIANAHLFYNVFFSLAAFPGIKPFARFLASIPPIDNNFRVR